MSQKQPGSKVKRLPSPPKLQIKLPALQRKIQKARAIRKEFVWIK